MRWPRPWRARKATRFPSSVPTTKTSEGFPNGVFTRTSLVSVRPLIAYKPLPPIMPMVGLPSFFAALGCFGFSTAIHLSPKDAQKYHIASTLLYRKYGGPDAAPPPDARASWGAACCAPTNTKSCALFARALDAEMVAGL